MNAECARMRKFESETKNEQSNSHEYNNKKYLAKNLNLKHYKSVLDAVCSKNHWGNVLIARINTEPCFSQLFMRLFIRCLLMSKHRASPSVHVQWLFVKF